MRSRSQDWAFGQLTELVQASEWAFEVLATTEPPPEGGNLTVVITIDCSPFRYSAGGVRFKARERLRLVIPSNFPLSIPRAYFMHKRYADCPHVQWGEYICLYQASDIEWVPGRGMFGFMRRVLDWLEAAALGELDPIGHPLHPPVAYEVGLLNIVPRQNAPLVSFPYWSGYIAVTREEKHVIELGRWIERSERIPEIRLATAILLPGSMPHEYPKSIADLLEALEARDVPTEILQAIIQLGVLRTPAGKRALFVLGAAMRGVAGERQLQHLACWRLDAELTSKLRDSAISATSENPIDSEAFYSWASEAQIEWCRVLEERPEIIERRDSNSPAIWWHGKTVTLLGCGAIGSAVALMLARAGVARLKLFDKSVVTPGILVRQGYPRNHVGYTKASSLQVAVQGANAEVEVSTDVANIVSAFHSDTRLEQIFTADVIVDATASQSVSAAFELHFRSNPKKHPPLVSMSIGHNGDFGIMTLASEKTPGMSFHLDRQAKLMCANSTRGHPFLEEFWPAHPERREFFQPEPGCSSPTFRGSYIDTLGLVARMTNIASTWLAASGGADPRAFALDLSQRSVINHTAREIEFALTPYVSLRESLRSYEIRLSKEAVSSMLSWMRRTERLHDDRTETGGILFGQVDEFLEIVWIDEVSGPPPDSVASPHGFVCGTAGVNSMNVERTKRTRGSVGFVGMWHTHPDGLPIPSATDVHAMLGLFSNNDVYGGRNFLMLIVGGASASPIFSASLFSRRNNDWE